MNRLHRVTAIAVIAAATAGVLSAVAFGGSTAPSEGPGHPPADLLAKVSNAGDCVRAQTRLIAPPQDEDLRAFQGSGWIADGRFLGTAPELASALSAIETRSGSDWAWIRTSSVLRGFAGFNVQGRVVWVEIESIEKVPCGTTN